MKFILGTIAKNEGSFLKEWVLYHKWVCGFDEIFVYNNDSEDDSKDVLNKLSEMNFCRWIDWPRNNYTNPPYQTFMFNFFNIAKSTPGWACILDVDEFLVLNKHDDIKSFVESFPENTGSISVNWNMMYSTQVKKQKKPITRGITHCLGPNGHVKTIAKTNAIKSPGMHTFDLASGYKYLHSSGIEYDIDISDIRKKSSSLDAHVCIQDPIIDCRTAQVNHYRIKSKEDCIVRDNNGHAASINYSKKNSIDQYNRLSKKNDHLDDNKISEFINKKFMKFYEYIEDIK